MLECEWTSLVHAYYDGELPAPQRAAVEAHLHQCVACAEELRSLERLSVRIRSASLPMPPRDLVRGIVARVGRAQEAGAIRLAWWLTAAAAMVVVVCQIYLVTGTRSQGVGTKDLVIADSGSGTAWDLTRVMLAADAAQGADLSDEHQVAQWVIDELSSHTPEPTEGVGGDGTP